MNKISIIMPCYQTAENIPVTSKVVFDTEKLYKDDVVFEYIFVDDGSVDSTLEELLKLHSQNPEKVKVVKLSRNFGANNASLAGLNHATGDCCVILAADLQDPPELIPKMFDYWKKGIKLVVANRDSREESFRRTFAANIYHFIMRMIVPTRVPRGGFDLVLMDKKIKDHLISIDEKNAYIPYLIMWLGFDYVSIPYVRRKREIGESMWTLSKKIKAAIDSVIAFSFTPIRTISIVGLTFGVIAFLWALRILYFKLFGGGESVEGWTSLMVVLLGVSSFQMISLGVIGEYVWRTLDASRKRPNFVIDSIYAKEKVFENVKKIKVSGN